MQGGWFLRSGAISSLIFMAFEFLLQTVLWFITHVRRIKVLLLILHMKRHKKMKWVFKVTGQVNPSWVKNLVFQPLSPNSWCYISLYYWYEQISALENTVTCLREFDHRGSRSSFQKYNFMTFEKLITIAQVDWGSFCRLVCKKA